MTSDVILSEEPELGEDGVATLDLDRGSAERELQGIVGDEPGWEEFLSLVEIELVAGGAN